MPRDMDDLLSDPRFRKRLLQRLEEGWSFAKIEPMSTKTIFARLNRLGIRTNPKDFKAAVQRYDSAQRLSEGWFRRFNFKPEGRYDEDFVWMAAIVLWKRLAPGKVSFEQIDERIGKGYELLEARRTTEACDVWWQVWGWVKGKVTPERNTLDALDEAMQGTYSIYDWCQDFEMELGNAGLDDPAYHRLRIQYCREFLATFPDVSWLMRGNFLRAEAEAYWRLGERDVAEARFAALVEENPDWGWGYIAWSDEYWLGADSPKDYDRAEAILLQGLGRPRLEDKKVVRDRLKRLRAERKSAKG